MNIHGRGWWSQGSPSPFCLTVCFSLSPEGGEEISVGVLPHHCHPLIPLREGTLSVQLPLQIPVLPTELGLGKHIQWRKPLRCKMWKEIALLRELLTFS